jgi:hypothetical protein
MTAWRNSLSLEVKMDDIGGRRRKAGHDRAVCGSQSWDLRVCCSKEGHAAPSCAKDQHIGRACPADGKTRLAGSPRLGLRKARASRGED